ncbi:hypothetical protein Cni_G29345 [Canna indica]|uniref:Uncharacterized protein n=1 Tax=Canna indica TaxID=4628 RepID=A0AAQ3L686_9LILI|nr:hypothetical protein Cni_G29345 [Canna indica]
MCHASLFSTAQSPKRDVLYEEESKLLLMPNERGVQKFRKCSCQWSTEEGARSSAKPFTMPLPGCGQLVHSEDLFNLEENKFSFRKMTPLAISTGTTSTPNTENKHVTSL